MSKSPGHGRSPWFLQRSRKPRRGGTRAFHPQCGILMGDRVYWEVPMKRFSLRYLLLPAVLVVATANADTLVLRDGRRIQGHLISVQNGFVEFEGAQTFGGNRAFRLDRNEVLGIEFDHNDGNAARFPPPASTSGGRPYGLRERQVMVAANVRSIDTNIDVQPGQDVYFESSGEVRWGPSRRDGPAGEQNSPINANRPMPNRPAAALIGRVGATSTDYFYIGDSRGPIRMRSSGRLFLAINDDVLDDNSG